MRRFGGAVTIGGGIFASRLLGFVRDRAIAHYFGAGAIADVFFTALRGPNILQNLLGEQALSASFIPVYSRLLRAGREEEAGRFAGAIFGLLLAVTAGLVLVGVLLARPLVAVLVPGFLGDGVAVAAGEAAVDRYELAVKAVRILFPMTGFAVLAAWCLGVLNSHRRFFLPYFAPVLWNAAIIAALVGTGMALGGRGSGETLLLAACLGALAGGILQFLVQLPLALRLQRGFRLALDTRTEGVREALRNFGPALAGRGVVQLGNYVDQVVSSFLVAGGPSALSWALRFYALPVSLFGLSVAAAELPELSRLAAGEEATMRSRLRQAWRSMAFLTVPTVLGYFVFGFLIVEAVYRTGEFTTADSWLVFLILAAYSCGLLATTSSRLLQNGFFALGDTRTPAAVALLRLAVSVSIAIPLCFWWLDRYTISSLGLPAGGQGLRIGAVGLGLAAGVAGWLELVLLRHRLQRRLPGFSLPWGRAARLLLVAAVAAVPAALLWWWLRGWHPLPLAALVVGGYGGLYLALAYALGLEEARAAIGRFARRREAAGE